MERAQVFAQVAAIFRDVFDNEALEIQESTNSDDIEDWDSLNHINLVVAIEKQFKIKFSLEELSGLKDVGAMIDLMMHKLA